MTALLRPDETLTLGVNVIVREGDRDVTHEIELDAPQDWVALTGPCPTCNGSKRRELLTTNFIDCPDCVDGRRIVPLYRECPTLDWMDASGRQPLCRICDGTGRVLVARGIIEVVPVVDTNNDWDGPHLLVRSDGWCFFIAEDGEVDGPLPPLDPLPVPGRDWGIVIDCVELAA